MTKRNRDIVTIIGIIAIVGLAIIFMYGLVQGSNSTNSTLTLKCIRMFYSDEWNKGYVEDLAKFCSNGEGQ